MKLLELLRSLFIFALPDPDPKAAPDPNAVDPNSDPGDPSADLEVDLDADPEAGKGDEDRPSAEEFAAAQAAVKAEKERADRYERELAEARKTRQPPEDEITRQENAILADDKASELQKWQVQANRELRRGRSEAQMALAQAHDVADKTAFAAISIKSPAVFKRYEARVEEALAKMRSAGQNASRESILKYLIGEDAMAGNLKRKTPEKTGDDKGVPRGKLPGAKSDVSGRSGAMTAKQKLEKKLENVQI